MSKNLKQIYFKKFQEDKQRNRIRFYCITQSKLAHNIIYNVYYYFQIFFLIIRNKRKNTNLDFNFGYEKEKIFMNLFYFFKRKKKEARRDPQFVVTI